LYLFVRALAPDKFSLRSQSDKKHFISAVLVTVNGELVTRR
jgi:hypothetical protein